MAHSIKIYLGTQTVRAAPGSTRVVSVGIQGPVGATGATGAAGATGATGPGVPTGGTVNQVLAKLSSTNYDAAWVDPASSSSIAWANVTGKPAPVTALLGVNTGDQDLSAYLTIVTAAATYSVLAHTHAYSSLSGLPTLGTAAAKDVPATGNASATQVVYGTDTRLTDARTPTAHTHSFASLTGKPTTLAGYGITDGLTPAGATGDVQLNDGAGRLAASDALTYTSGFLYVGTSGTDGVLNVRGADGVTKASINAAAMIAGFGSNVQVDMTAGTVLAAGYVGDTLTLGRVAGGAAGSLSVLDVGGAGTVGIDGDTGTVTALGYAGISAGMVAGLAAVASSGDAADLGGTLSDARLSANVPLLTGGLLPTSVLPALAITEVTVVGSQAAMLALTAQRGDVAIRSDLSKSFALSTDSPTTLADWKELLSPTDAVTSVNGNVGVIVLGPTDVGAQPADATLAAIAGLTPGGSTAIYFTGTDVATTYSLTATGRQLAGAADAAAVRATLGLGTTDSPTFAAVAVSSLAATGTVTGSNLSGTNTGNQTITLTGDATGGGTGSFAVTVGKINGTSLAGLATGILKNTTTTGVPSIAVAGDFPTLNQSTTGSAATLTTPRAIYGNNFDGSAALAQVIASTYGGTGNGFAKFSGPTTTEKTFTLPDASAAILTDNAVVTSQQGGTGVNNGGRTLTVAANSGTISFTSSVTLTVAAAASVSGTNTGDQTSVSGNAGTATALQTPRTINGTNFDGTADIVIGAIPQNSKSAAYTTVLADAGKHLLHPAADTTARNFTIDSNANVAYPVGTTITFVNEHGAGVVTIKITTDTMRLAGAGTTGDRTLAADGIATALKVTSTSWIISGTGLT